MKKIISFFSISIVILFCGTLTAQSWRVSTPYNGNINDIFFTDKLTGYACGIGAGIGNCTATGLLIKTIDGGSTWTRMNTGSTDAVNKLFFKDAFTGWSVGDFSRVQKTTDGGVTWTLLSYGIGAGLNDIYFVNYNLGFICGLNGLLRRSTDGGANFTTVNSGVTSTLYGVHFVNASVGFIVGDNGVIRKSINGGTSFSSVYSGTDVFRDIYFTSDSVGFVMSYNKVLKTTNQGSSWSVFNADPSWIMTRMHFTSTQTGFIIGDNGLILKTTNGGTTWNKIVTTASSYLRSVFFTDENTGYYGKDLGSIYKTTDGGLTWNSVLSGLGEELFSVQFRTRAIGLTVGNSGGIYRTTNGGLNWSHRNDIHYSPLHCVRWMTDQKAIATGSNGTIVKSDDAGVHWYQINTGITDQMNDIHVVDSMTIYITHGIGKILKTTDGGISWDTTLNTGSAFPLTGIYFLNADTGYTCGNMEIYKTNNGGATWTLKNDSISLFTTFNDIFFPSNDTGYVAGTFGKLYRTVNGGEWWRAVYPPSTSNAEINEIQFFNNNTGYFAGSTSQRVTFDGGSNLSVMPTACLANNWETLSISRPEDGYAYCVGGQVGILHTLQKDSMLSTYLQDSIFCTGSRLFVGYFASGLLLGTQVLDIQLSDANGSFTSPSVIGTFQLYKPIINPSGIATCTLPAGLTGNGFRIRVACNNPQLVSADNGFDIKISSNVIPDVNLELSDSINCMGDTLRFIANANGGGVNPAYLWTLDNHPLNWEAGAIAIDTLHGNHVLKVEMTSSLSCALNSSTDSLHFEVYQFPTADAGINQSICEGESVTIGSSNNAGPFVWFPSAGLNDDTAAMPTASPLSTQNYILTTTGFHGCKGHDTVNVFVNSLPVIHVSGNIILCEGDSTLLTASSSTPHITWSPAGVLSADTGIYVYAFPASDEMVYASTVDDSSCYNLDSIRIHVVPAATPPVLSIVNTFLVVTVSTQNLEWYINGVLIPGYNNDTLFNPADGTYIVKITDSNGCVSWSQEIVFSVSGMNNNSINSVRIFVADGILQLRVPDAHSENAELNLYDECGRLIFNKSILLDHEGFGKMDIKNISRGIYISRIKIKGAVKTVKIVLL